MNKLAIFGGQPVRTELFPAYNTMGDEEVAAAAKVIKSGVLSKYLGCWDPDFFGGPFVQEFEDKWAQKNESEYAVSVNSNTSGLIVSLGALGISTGDQVITSPYTMSASASACLFWGGVPVFADIDDKTFNISAETIEPKITKRTKAIVVVHIFGKPADMLPIIELAKKYNLRVVEDCAQAPFTKYKDKYVGNWGDAGVFSLNYHKHIHTGEGGVITTNDKNLKTRCQLIRNHAEAVVDDMGIVDLKNMWGFNNRLGEIEAAIGIEQVKKFDGLQRARWDNTIYLQGALNNIDYIDVCNYNHNYGEHAYYVMPIKYLSNNNNLSRKIFLTALSAELPSSYMREGDPLIGGGYVKPLYLQQLYQKRAFNYAENAVVSYNIGECPVCEDMHFNKLITSEFMRPGMSKKDLDDVVAAFKKIDSNIDELISRQDEL